MPEVTIVYWRDIPAQVIVGKGRRGSKRQLAERFEQAIDMAAMRAGMAGTHDYLTQWRKAAPYSVEGDAEDVAEQEANRLETCLLYTSPSPRDQRGSRMPSSA